MSPHRFHRVELALKAELQSPSFLELRTVQRLGNWDIDLEEELIPTKRTDLRVKPNAKRGVKTPAALPARVFRWFV